MFTLVTDLDTRTSSPSIWPSSRSRSPGQPRPLSGYRHGASHQDNLALYLAIVAAALLTGTADSVVVHGPVGAALASRDERLLYGCHVTVDALREHIAELFYAQFDEGGRMQQSVLDIECQQSAVGSVDDLLAVNLEKGVRVAAR